MKIAILGTRGIPNNYGGFEQCAEYISVYFAKRGNEVTVYNPDDHPFKENIWNGVKIKRIFCHEKKIKIWGTLIYDYLCLKDARKNDFDIILEMGYDPNAIFYDFAGKSKSKLVSNMDGLDWKRSKWNKPIKKFIKYCEKLAAFKSDVLIADNLGIKEHIKESYNKDSHYIPYGAKIFSSPEEKCLKEYEIEKFGYYLIISRLEPENSIETILDGYIKSGVHSPFVIVGGHMANYGNYLKNKYANIKAIKFVGGIYNFEVLGSLRWYSKMYFHGHSVGGTNPSLLESMAANAYIVAYDNIFNRNVTGDDALYFKSSEDVSKIINNYDENEKGRFIENNMVKIKDIFNWEIVSEKYLEVFENIMK